MNAAVPLPVYARLVPGGLELRLKVVPGASRDGVAGILGDRLKVRVAAAPEAGKANRAVLALLTSHFGVRVELVAGASGAEKSVRLAGAVEWRREWDA